MTGVFVLICDCDWGDLTKIGTEMNENAAKGNEQMQGRNGMNGVDPFAMFCQAEIFQNLS